MNMKTMFRMMDRFLLYELFLNFFIFFKNYF